ncbi:hypothetical protein [Emcibacter sp.]|uniref:hypothetical protein n=1 Tax=Emcibacter sp. TaxID=1979954 RepID=UPI002AA7F469|nr:hypothetical protein [Emcibacter sp.]
MNFISRLYYAIRAAMNWVRLYDLMVEGDFSTARQLAAKIKQRGSLAARIRLIEAEADYSLGNHFEAIKALYEVHDLLEKGMEKNEDTKEYLHHYAAGLFTRIKLITNTSLRYPKIPNRQGVKLENVSTSVKNYFPDW